MDIQTLDVACGAGRRDKCAIELALNGAQVLLVEEKVSARQTLWRVYLPECLAHFKRLGLSDQMTPVVARQ